MNPTTTNERPPIDVDALVNRCLGDRGLAERVLGMFAAQAPTTVRKIEQGLASGNADGAAKAAHAIKGSAANLSADGVSDLAGQLETLCRANAIDRATEMLAGLKAELDRCLTYIPTLTPASNGGGTKG